MRKLFFFIKQYTVSPKQCSVRTELIAGGREQIEITSRETVGFYPLHAAWQEYEPVGQQEYVPALINLGNIFLLQNQNKRAREFFERANRKEPQRWRPCALVAGV